MRASKLLIYCELCGSDTLSCTADFITFHHLSFCSPDCRDSYRTADEEKRRAKEQPARSRGPSRAA